MTRCIDDILKDIHKVQEEIDNEWWTFTRCARGKPVRHELYVKRTELEKELEEARTAIRNKTVIR